MYRERMLKVAALVPIICLAAAAATADVLAKQGQLRFEAGAFCNSPTDSKRKAPETVDGEVGVHNKSYHFIHQGDTAPALPDIAIGIVIHLEAFTRGETLNIQQCRMEDSGDPDTWTKDVEEDGRFGFGTTPDPGKGLPEGHYQNSVLRGGEVIFGCEFIVVAAAQMPNFKSRCDLDIS